MRLLEDLPPIDVILISHNHYDHLDLPTLRRLVREHHPRIVTPMGNHALLERGGVAGAQELEWWEGAELSNGARMVAVPAQHLSGRGLTDRDRALWAGYVIESPAGAVYFAGDSGYMTHAVGHRCGAHARGGATPEFRAAQDVQATASEHPSHAVASARPVARFPSREAWYAS